eukprot:GHVT01074251.1.p1 GENE.GHVT01074251.1~~GHVT01074251.1.p1  ORF type:complete len:105 (+),score=14.08 GHVT01074251.1:1443-1757(+)
MHGHMGFMNDNGFSPSSFSWNLTIYLEASNTGASSVLLRGVSLDSGWSVMRHRRRHFLQQNVPNRLLAPDASLRLALVKIRLSYATTFGISALEADKKVKATGG